jgi:hypothetical protein
MEQAATTLWESNECEVDHDCQEATTSHQPLRLQALMAKPLTIGQLWGGRLEGGADS